MKRILISFLMVVVMSAMAAPLCWACTCPYQTKKENAKGADVIFTGKVVKVETKDDGESVTTRFRLGKVYKGQAKRFTNVFTDNGSTCGFLFEKGEKYTVFAHLNDGKKTTNTCSGTKRGSINPDNYDLGKPYAPKSDS